MRILFVTDDYLIDPLGTAWLSAELKLAGHEVDICNVKEENPLTAIIMEPEMLCYSVTTGKHKYYQELNAELRGRMNGTVVSVFGGPHVTFFPEYIQGDWMDLGVRGEGFQAIVDIADALESRIVPTEIDNVVHRSNGVTANPLRPARDKTTLPIPDRELIYKYSKNHDNRIKNVMCSFRCPFSCAYCFSRRYKEMYSGLWNGTQIRPVEKVMEEIDDLRRYPLELIFFNDDIFPIYDKGGWLDDFCAYYEEVGIPFHIQLRAEYVKEDAIKQLKAVGLHGVTFAIESGNETVRRRGLGRQMSNGRIVEAADVLHKHDIKLRTENMIGVPSESWETAMQTVDLNVRCQPEIGWASLYQPYPGTELGDKCVRDGLFDGDLDALSGSFFDTYKLDVPEGRKYERLQKLFSFFVEHPRLRFLIPVLVRMRLDGLYKRFYAWYKKRLYGRLYRV
jgi:radical SAM superfamily enzyme YgiQ (UPF0313 family)